MLELARRKETRQTLHVRCRQSSSAAGFKWRGGRLTTVGASVFEMTFGVNFSFINHGCSNERNATLVTTEQVLQIYMLHSDWPVTVEKDRSNESNYDE